MCLFFHKLGSIRNYAFKEKKLKWKWKERVWSFGFSYMKSCFIQYVPDLHIQHERLHLESLALSVSSGFISFQINIGLD